MLEWRNDIEEMHRESACSKKRKRWNDTRRWKNERETRCERVAGSVGRSCELKEEGLPDSANGGTRGERVSEGWWEVITGVWWMAERVKLGELAEEKGFDTNCRQLAMAQFALVPRRVRFVYVFLLKLSFHTLIHSKGSSPSIKILFNRKS